MPVKDSMLHPARPASTTHRQAVGRKVSIRRMVLPGSSTASSPNKIQPAGGQGVEHPGQLWHQQLGSLHF